MQRIWEKLYHNNQKFDFKNNHSIYQIVSEVFKKYPNNAALSCMGTTVTYVELERMVNRFADYLKNTAGVKPGDRIAIMLPNIIQFPIVFLAALRVGAVCVPTNPMYTPREMKHQFCDSGAKFLVIIDLFANKLEEIIKETKIESVIITSVADQLPALKSLVVKLALKLKRIVPTHNLKVTHFLDAMKLGSVHYKDVHRGELNDTAFLQYTGGTTGVSKGAELTNGNILANIIQIRHAIELKITDGQETVLTALPLYHIYSLTLNFLAFLANGHHLILVPKPIPIENTVKAFQKYRITVMSGVNTLYNALNHSELFKQVSFVDLKLAVAGGMALHESVAQTFAQITGVQIYEAYGLTESSPGTHVNPLIHPPHKGSIGIPILGTDCKIVDDNGVEVAIGEVGEICIKGPQVMKGYWNQPEETAKTIRDGWLYTGDLGRADEEGYFYIVDRKKDMILVSGFNVYPNEIEEVISKHPKVLEVAAIGIKDGAAGESVKVFIVKKDQSLTESEIKDYCRENLTGYKRPRTVEFRESLPKSNVGKILRKDLRPVS